MDNNQLQSKNAGFLIRFFAVTLDTLLIWILLLLCAYFVSKSLPFGFQTLQPRFVKTLALLILSMSVVFTFNIFYHIYFVSKFGGTLGKLLFGLKVVTADSDLYIDIKTAIYRFTAGYGFSSAFLGLGFLRIFKNKDRLAWHDELFNTKVVRTSSFIPGILAYMVLLAVVYLLASATFKSFLGPGATLY